MSDYKPTGELASFGQDGSTGNPLLLTLLCVVVLQKYEIPRRRVEFYRQCLEVLLYRWRYLLEEEEPPLNLELSLAVLRQMAWEMHFKGRQYDFTEQEFITLANGVLDRQGITVDGGLVLRWLHVTCGVLEEYSPKCYGLMHLGFQEYLAACHAASERQTLVEVLVGQSGEKWWKEVILLLAGLGDKDLFVRLVQPFLPELQAKEELLREILGEAPEVDLSPFEGRLANGQPAEQAAILRVLKGRSNSTLQEIERKLARQVTGLAIPIQAIIEPKTGIRLLPIPGGEFIMGSMDGHNDERPPHPVKLSPYLLAETPVTNRQYGVYLQENKDAKEPAFWRDRRFADPEQPVVGVSWQEAMAFCQWLAQGSDQNFTLPSEAQWEFAARGTDGRDYPWGKDKPTSKLACFGQDYSTGKPAPVGSYPVGRGSFGHLDLAGNVWEWCLDPWTEDYAQWNGGTVTDPVNSYTHKNNVVRGGSWHGGAVALRLAFRNGDHAVNRSGLVGFRLAAAPASI